MTRPMKKPRRGSDSRGAGAFAGSGLRRHSTAIPQNWRDCQPDPATYYAAHVAKLSRPNATGWAQGTCPLHNDHNASLSVHVTESRGGWRCFAGCGGGDLVGFHMLLRGLDFTAAVRELIGVNP